MLMTDEMTHLHGCSPITRGDDEAVESSIPVRYRDGRGGIDLEKVQQDQRKARREVVLAMIRRLTKRWHQRRGD